MDNVVRFQTPQQAFKAEVDARIETDTNMILERIEAALADGSYRGVTVTLLLTGPRGAIDAEHMMIVSPDVNPYILLGASEVMRARSFCSIAIERFEATDGD